MPDSHPFWDQMFGEDTYRYGTQPNTFLVEQAKHLASGGRILCVGDGEGRNGVWLAEQGFAVTSLDPSVVGLRKTEALAAARGVPVTTVHGALPEHPLTANHFDAAVLIYVHVPPTVRPELHAAVWDAIRPGGRVVLEAFTPEQLHYTSGGPRDPGMLYTAEVLRTDFPGAEIKYLEEVVRALDEGPGHQGRASVVQLRARKP